MRVDALKRVRLAFVALGLSLLVPLGLLLRSAEARLQAQRKLRHELVAERVFDEMEAELAALLDRESRRPSSAFEASDTQVAAWAPFVVGYFHRDRSGIDVVAREQLEPERVVRVERAVNALLHGAEDERRERWATQVQEEQKEQLLRARAAADEARAADEAARALQQEGTRASDVLRQLNRSRLKGRRSKPASPFNDDPLLGL